MKGGERREEGNRKGGKTDGPPKTRKGGSGMRPRLASEPIKEHVTLFPQPLGGPGHSRYSVQRDT